MKRDSKPGRGSTKRETTSMLKACRAGDYDLVREMLKAGVDPDCHGKHNITPLMEAAAGGFLPIVDLLLRKGSDANAFSNLGESAVAYASANNHPEIVRRLIKAGASATCWVYIGFKMSALTIASGRGLTDIVKCLLQSSALPNGTDEPQTPLRMAAENGHLEVVRLLLDYGAYPNVSSNGRLALSGFASRGSSEGVKLLVSAGADVNAKDCYGMTAFMWACRNGHLDVAKFLLACGADPAIRDHVYPQTRPNLRQDALDWAISQNKRDIVKWFASGAIKLSKNDQAKAKSFLKGTA